MRRRAFTLVELLVGAGLLSILLVVLFGSYQQVAKIHDHLRQLRRAGFDMRYTQYRLADTLAKATLTQAAPYMKDRDYHFFTSDEANSLLQGRSLVFTFDRGFDLRREFSNLLLARLYVDNQRQLCLVEWPAPSRCKEGLTPMKKEVLLEGVEEIRFSFYMPPDPESKEVHAPDSVSGDKEKVPPPWNQWSDHWQQNYQDLPPLMKITLIRRLKPEDSPQEIQYAFPLPNSRHLIHYKQ